VGSSIYSDCGGIYYQQVGNGWQVVDPPVGAMITQLPEGAMEQNVSGATYYLYANAYFQPFYNGSDVVYMIVEDPTA